MISVFDIFKIGIGPSSSHTVGPMKASNMFCRSLIESQLLEKTSSITVELFGSLGQTGKGHGTGKAIILGLCGYQPESVPIDIIEKTLKDIEVSKTLMLSGQKEVAFPNQGAIVFHRRKTLPKHANGMTITARCDGSDVLVKTYYSIGGGFVVEDEHFEEMKRIELSKTTNVPFPFSSATELLKQCEDNNFRISSLILKNEMVLASESSIRQQLIQIWSAMQECVERGINTEGILPGGLKVKRRAQGLYRRLQNEKNHDPMQVMDWVNLYALAVNEENADGGRVVTAPTNGAAGIIPAVMCYFNKFIREMDDDTACRFLLTAAAIGILYKKNASISGAEVGCQGEVGVACSMAAGALTEILGGNVQTVENAAEIGMEHNLGLTCDPVGGLVQVPCIERNAMGAVKAINASRLALRGDGNQKVSLDKVIKTMWDTGNDMKTKYKETARGGLAVNIIEC